jgi:dihydroneopterin aldolase
MPDPRFADASAAQRHVFLRDMVLGVRIGVHPREAAAPQRVRINVDLAVEDPEVAVGADALTRVVDYEIVAQKVRAIVGEGPVRLVETLAERIAMACLAADQRVLTARVRVEKLAVFADALSAGVEVERRRR